MIGDSYRSDGEEFEVVWSGGEGLVPDRESKPTGFWTPPKRLYNKKSEFWQTRVPKTGPNSGPQSGVPDGVDKPETEAEDGQDEPERAENRESGEVADAERNGARDEVVLRKRAEDVELEYLGRSDEPE